jgi:hypothetical protein
MVWWELGFVGREDKEEGEQVRRGAAVVEDHGGEKGGARSLRACRRRQGRGDSVSFETVAGQEEMGHTEDGVLGQKRKKETQRGGEVLL